MTTEQAIERLEADGFEHVSVAEFRRRYAELGYIFSNSDLIRQYSRFVSGELAGEGWNIAVVELRHRETGIGPFNVNTPKGDYEKVKVLRNSVFAVTRDGYILEV